MTKANEQAVDASVLLATIMVNREKGNLARARDAQLQLERMGIHVRFARRKSRKPRRASA